MCDQTIIPTIYLSQYHVFENSQYFQILSVCRDLINSIISITWFISIR